MAISEWDRRQLCPDGSCVGVIGPDGTCKACGRVAPDWGDERRRGLVPADDAGDDEDDDEGDEGDEEDELAPSAPALLGEAAEWQRRRLCPDGGCVGVIGADGRCKVCGKAAEGAGAKGDQEEDEDGDEDEDDDEDEEDEEAADEEGDEYEDDEEDEDDEEEEEEEEEDNAGRKLCPDGACIGLIGSDGRCKVCGKEAA